VEFFFFFGLTLPSSPACLAICVCTCLLLGCHSGAWFAISCVAGVLVNSFVLKTKELRCVLTKSPPRNSRLRERERERRDYCLSTICKLNSVFLLVYIDRVGSFRLHLSYSHMLNALGLSVQ
jgi:hypothetical protein